MPRDAKIPRNNQDHPKAPAANTPYRRRRDDRMDWHKIRRLPPLEERSAGGLVVDGSEKYGLVIGKWRHNGTFVWSLPKGHIQNNETVEEAALREIEEETGVIGHIVLPIGSTEYRFMGAKRRIHKTVQHFLVRALEGELSCTDHEVAEVTWVATDRLKDVLTHSNEQALVQAALTALGKS